MIKYSTGVFGVLFILRCKGSVFPKAVLMAAPNAVLAVLMRSFLHSDQDGLELLNMSGVNVLWAGFTSVLGFLIVFRNNQAYTRFWEGATLIHQVRGEWFNSISCLFAFCTRSAEHQQEVKVLQHTLIRLFSLLYCSALQQICDLDDDCFEIIETEGLEAESLAFMRESRDRCEVLLVWIQRLVVEASESGAIQVPAPLLTRSFQELSRGIVLLNNVLKIKEIPFPFPYAQLITSMLVLHWVVTPFIASQLIMSQVAAGVASFSVTFVLWCLCYITMEIDQPFGDDANDLPLHDMQKDFNRSLLTLMHPLAQQPPHYCYNSVRDSFQPTAERRKSGMVMKAMKSGEEDEPVSMVTHVMAQTAPTLKHPEEHGSQSRFQALMRATTRREWLDILVPHHGEPGPQAESTAAGGGAHGADLPSFSQDSARGGSPSSAGDRDGQGVDDEGRLPRIETSGRASARGRPRSPRRKRAEESHDEPHAGLGQGQQAGRRKLAPEALTCSVYGGPGAAESEW